MVTDEYMLMWMGLDVRSWKTLQDYYIRFGSTVPDRDDLLNEITRLRGKLSFYEARIKDMYGVLQK